MKKILLAYYSLGEVPKVVLRAEKLFLDLGIEVQKLSIETKPLMNIKKQKKLEKTLALREVPPSLEGFDLVILGTPIVHFSSIPAINVFIRSLPQCENTKFILFATGIGLPGSAIKKMKSLLSMKGAKVVASQSFVSIFEFDSKILGEVEEFFRGIIEKEND